MVLLANCLPIEALAAPGHFLLLNDRIATSGQFLLHHILSASLKESTSCVLISFLEPLDDWTAIQTKFGTTLPTYLERKSFVFVDAFSQISTPPSLITPSQDPLVVPPIDATASTPLHPLFDTIEGAVRTVESERPKLVLFDEVSTLEWFGGSQDEVMRFWRSILALKERMGFGLVVLQNLDPSHPRVVDTLLSACMMQLEVSPLASGRSSAVTGELAIQRGPLSLPDDPCARAASKQPLQYRLTESGAVWIERGTGGGML